MNEEEVKQLAETLKNHGLAASMYEAMEKAKSILSINTAKKDNNKESESILDKDVPLNELMKQAGINPEEVEAEEQEKIENVNIEAMSLKRKIQQAENEPQKAEHIQEEIEKVKEELSQIEDNKQEQHEENKNEAERNEASKEKKFDLTKIFGFRKK
ncbi:hypothetical protein HYX01_03220 [Candidatus Woesearchaeota archaeon]|nr:hypothetical protein [Candidatus Woesearchaeota archaeon]